MDFNSKVLIYIFLTTPFVISCLGQMENMGMLALAGGLRGMGNGGMGTGGMGAGGMGIRMMGMGGGMGLGLAAAGITPVQYAMLDNTVKSVVGPHARPDIALITYAAQQGGSPTTPFQMLGYVPFFQHIARTVGLQQKTASGQSGTGTYRPQNINDIVMQRSVQWIQRNGLMMSSAANMF